MSKPSKSIQPLSQACLCYAVMPLTLPCATDMSAVKEHQICNSEKRNLGPHKIEMRRTKPRHLAKTELRNSFVSNGREIKRMFLFKKRTSETVHNA